MTKALANEDAIVEVRFLAGATAVENLPPPVHVEIAFAGRSNVGKSSLINTLVGRKNLVRTSSTPGSTRQIGIYEARARSGAVFHFVDLPGYGYSKRSKAERAAWSHLIENYLRSRVTLAAVVLIIDVRRGLEPDDAELITFLETAREAARRPVQVIVAATKSDKLSSAARGVAVKNLEREAGRKVIGFSALSQEGKPALLRALTRALEI